MAVVERRGLTAIHLNWLLPFSGVRCSVRESVFGVLALSFFS